MVFGMIISRLKVANKPLSVTSNRLFGWAALHILAIYYELFKVCFDYLNIYTIMFIGVNLEFRKKYHS
jgi:hypothetical protein